MQRVCFDFRVFTPTCFYSPLVTLRLVNKTFLLFILLRIYMFLAFAVHVVSWDFHSSLWIYMYKYICNLLYRYRCYHRIKIFRYTCMGIVCLSFTDLIVHTRKACSKRRELCVVLNRNEKKSITIPLLRQYVFTNFFFSFCIVGRGSWVNRTRLWGSYYTRVLRHTRLWTGKSLGRYTNVHADLYIQCKPSDWYTAPMSQILI